MRHFAVLMAHFSYGIGRQAEEQNYGASRPSDWESALAVLCLTSGIEDLSFGSRCG